MQPGKSPTPFDDTLDLVYACVSVVVLIFIAMSVGCVSVTSESEEPLWKPHAYLYSPRPDGRCADVSRSPI